MIKSHRYNGPLRLKTDSIKQHIKEAAQSIDCLFAYSFCDMLNQSILRSVPIVLHKKPNEFRNGRCEEENPKAIPYAKPYNIFIKRNTNLK